LSQAHTKNCVAGLTAFQNESHYYAINVRVAEGRLTEISLERAAAGARRGRRGRGERGAAPPQPTVLATQSLPDNSSSIVLKIEGAGPITKCFYKTAGGEYTQLGGDLESSFLSTETAGGFQGVTLGMFAHD
jgi:alpha-N-arabinofuranosidase